MTQYRHGGRRPNQTGRPPKWGKRMQWNVWLPVDLAKRVDVARRKVEESQSEYITKALLMRLQLQGETDHGMD